MNDRKRIGILTSGGDCAGLNSVITAAFERTKILGYDLVGIRRGVKGLIDGALDYFVFSQQDCLFPMFFQPGSVLLSNTKHIPTTEGSLYSTKECIDLAIIGYHKLKLDGLIFIGGDGSISIMYEFLTQYDEINAVVIPKTIDNDVAGTDAAIGFVTAIEIVSNFVENLISTAISHERVMVVEVMGRDAGFIAMYAGIATGADIVLVPEFEYDPQKLIESVRRCYSSGKNYCLIIVAEAVKPQISVLEAKDEAGRYIADFLKENGFDARSVVLGHVQRGGKTSIVDRILGSAFGIKAVDLLVSGQRGVMLVCKNSVVESIPLPLIAPNLNKKLNSNDMCVKIAQSLGVYIGNV
jgi:6-phosphofructokinase 1